MIVKGGRLLLWSFFIKDILSVRCLGFGMGLVIFGMLIMMVGVLLMVILFGVFGVVYFYEYGKGGWVVGVLCFFVNVMSGVLSIVMGLFIVTIWVLCWGVDGFSGFVGLLVLGCLMFLIIIWFVEEMLKLVFD